MTHGGGSIFSLLRRARRLLKKLQEHAARNSIYCTRIFFFLPHGNLAGNGSLERCAQQVQVTLPIWE